MSAPWFLGQKYHNRPSSSSAASSGQNHFPPLDGGSTGVDTRVRLAIFPAAAEVSLTQSETPVKPCKLANAVPSSRGIALEIFFS